MLHIIIQLQEKIKKTELDSSAALEDFRRDFISKKGKLATLFEAFKTLSTLEKKQIGPALNDLKQTAEKKFKEASKQCQQSTPQTAGSQPVDVTLPAIGPPLGSLHPVRIVQNKIIALFEQMGFNLTEGLEIVDDWHNFAALNFPENHPARAMQDTFFLQRHPDRLLRTHTTSVQIAACTAQSPPIRSITAGRVFRNEAISARSHCFFHQVDGMFIDTHVTFSDLQATIRHLVSALFGAATPVRFRASYFPFTKPSIEVDIGCILCQGKGCTVCKQSGWVEILGAGMIDPTVLMNCRIDAAKQSGFAFGMGMERIAMLLYKIEDVRLFSEHDLMFLRQFTACADL
ncbi:MAG: phenylalanine--tRNA ligase subunit alpha [Candidatus Cardinium sp.]|nr:phenylalanine--tRNA ligase subunit alpha [Candidatus Cardinium sp.]